MSSIGAALGAAFVSSARAEASRINGARSRGPKTPAGKARSSQNALKHGFRAEKFTVVGDEDEDVYDAHEQALLDELAPEGALQTLLAERIARAAWRLARADTIEAMLFDRLADTSDLGLALIRDGHGTRAFETLLRYRGAAQAELMRALRTLKALQAEARAEPAAEPALIGPRRAGPAIERAPDQRAARPAACKKPIEPKRANLAEATPTQILEEHAQQAPDLGAGDDVPRRGPNEPEPSAWPADVRPNEPERSPAALAARPQRAP